MCAILKKSHYHTLPQDIHFLRTARRIYEQHDICITLHNQKLNFHLYNQQKTTICNLCVCEAVVAVLVRSSNSSP